VISGWSIKEIKKNNMLDAACKAMNPDEEVRHKNASQSQSNLSPSSRCCHKATKEGLQDAEIKMINQ